MYVLKNVFVSYHRAMMRRHNVNIISLLFTASILLIIDISIRYTDNKNFTCIGRQQNAIVIKKIKTGEDTCPQQIPIILNDDNHFSIEMKNIISEMRTENHSYGFSDLYNVTIILQDETRSFKDMTSISNIMLEKARLKIKYDSSNYNFSQSSVHRLEDLVIESGGQPLRSLIISTWRSGSTFTGDLVTNARPNTYYQYEPLFKYGTKQFKTPQEGIEPVGIVKRMFNCDYKGLDDYFEMERKHFREGKPNTRMWNYCKYEDNIELCFNADFTSRLCKLFPFLNMKLVRLRLRLVEDIMDDKTLNVKVILLVRDPRGVMQSRLHQRSCKLSPDCWDPSMVCADMVSDYAAARRLLQQYPDRLIVVRFEELALQINITSDKILNFLKVQRTQVFDEFLQLHTNTETTGDHTTFKVSRNVPYKWKTALDFNFVNKIQMACSDAMALWGYKMAHNETHMKSKDFNPVENKKGVLT